jgi:two-component system nitrate/nitrite response regulator NarL
MSEQEVLKPIRVVLADDHQMVRLGLRHMLNRSEYVEVVAEAQNGQEAWDAVQEHKPDVVITDILMPVMNGIELTKLIKTEHPSIAVIILTSFEDLNHFEKAIESGANGYLSKDILPDVLTDALKSVMAGEQVFNSDFLKALSEKGRISYDNNSATFTLTKREQEILMLVAEGQTSQEIADSLFISPRTVETHRANIMQKLNVHNTAGLIKFVMKNQAYLNYSVGSLKNK